MAETHDGGGYWLVDANGSVFRFGDAMHLALREKARSRVVGFAVTPDGTGAWMAERGGTVLSLGTAIDRGSLTGVPTTSYVVSIAAVLMPPATTLAYDLAEANGRVVAVGKAAYYGSAFGKHLVASIIDLVSTPDRKGYWLIGADGSVYPFGDAEYEGGAGGRLRRDPVVAVATTPDGAGYWLVTVTGGVMAFGDARNYGSIRSSITGHVVAIVSSTDGKGYWIAFRTGRVFNFGDAKNYGSARPGNVRQLIFAMAAMPDGGGYWLAEANGNVLRFGDAVHLATFYPARVSSPVVGLAVTPDGTGDWMAEQNGTVLNFGTATAHGAVKGRAASSPVTSIAAMPVAPPPSLQYPHGSFGYDINWPQCAASGSSQTVALPGPPSYPSGTIDYAVAVVGVDGWAVGKYNPCLQAEVGWAAKAQETGGAPYDLYMFLNSPTSSDTIDQQGPAGTCSQLSATAQPGCLAYNYGYNAAQAAVEYANSQGATSPVWWLDVENDICGQYWSCNQALNSATIQGAIDFLHAQRLTAGIYSTSVQYQGITGGYVPPGPQVPIWVAGAYWTSPPYPSSFGYYPPSALAPYCGVKYAFAGGDTWLLQETPGPNDYPFDPDYAC
jgi:hypothetical protein